MASNGGGESQQPLPTQHDGDEIYRCLGRAIAAWADVEALVFVLFYKTLGASYEKCAVVFNSSGTLSTKLQLTDRIMKVAVSEGKYKKWAAILKDINKHIPTRNSLAHNRVEEMVRTTKYETDSGLIKRVEVTLEKHSINPPSKILKSGPQPINTKAMDENAVAARKISTDLRVLIRSLPKTLRGPKKPASKRVPPQGSKHKDSTPRQTKNSSR